MTKLVSGSVSTRGNSFQGTYCLQERKPNGKPKTKTFTGKDKAEVIAKMNKFHYEYTNGLMEAEKSKDTIGTFVNNWLWKVVKSSKRTSTFENYKSIVENQIVPLLGDKNIHELNSEDVLDMFEVMKKRQHKFEIKKSGKHNYEEKEIFGLSSRTIELTKVVLGAALNHAVETHVINFNPVRTTAVKDAVVQMKENKVFKDKMDDVKKSMTVEEVKLLMTEVEKLERYKEVVKIQFLLGLRPGEALGLQWKCVDFEKGLISIKFDLERNIYYDKDGNRISKKELGKVKKNSCIRKLHVSDVVMGILFPPS